MADNKTAEERSKNMAAIRSRDTSPELFLRQLLFARGYRYRLYSKKIPGHPDLWLRKYNTAIYVHGCFWHRHANCKYAYIPKSRTEYWVSKFERNKARDCVVRGELTARNVKCLIIWECSIKKAKKRGGNPEELLLDIEHFLHSDEAYLEI